MEESKHKPVTKACLECRSRHLKCDGEEPICGRCSTNERKCVFIQSKRGGKRKREKDGELVTMNIQENQMITIELTTNIPPESISSLCLSTELQDGESQLLSLYYRKFHPSHPFLPSRHHLSSYFDSDPLISQQLLPAIFCIASNYSPQHRYLLPTFQKQCEASITSSSPNISVTQALILLSISLHASGQTEKAWEIKNSGLIVAEKLNLFSIDSSDASDDGLDKSKINVLWKESTRRTAWELLLLDSMLSALHGRHTTQFHQLLQHNRLHLALPIEDEDYEQGNTQNSGRFTLDDFDGRFFALDCSSFPSHAYRIDAMRVLSRILGIVNTPEEIPYHQNDFDVMDVTLSSSVIQLQNLKEKDNRKEFDMIIFQAEMLLNSTIIYLHRRFSHLSLAIVSNSTACTTSSSSLANSEEMIVQNDLSSSVHTAKCLTAADAIVKLISRSTSSTISSVDNLTSKTPFFACSIAVASMTHIAAASWATLFSPPASNAVVTYLPFKEVVKLELEALQSIENVWPIAGIVRKQIEETARDVFASNRV